MTVFRVLEMKRQMFGLEKEIPDKQFSLSLSLSLSKKITNVVLLVDLTGFSLLRRTEDGYFR